MPGIHGVNSRYPDWVDWTALIGMLVLNWAIIGCLGGLAVWTDLLVGRDG